MTNKPCPFCGSDGEYLEHSQQWVGNARKTTVECLNCGAVGPLHFNRESDESAKEGAQFVWNDRFETSEKGDS